MVIEGFVLSGDSGVYKMLRESIKIDEGAIFVTVDLIEEFSVTVHDFG